MQRDAGPPEGQTLNRQRNRQSAQLIMRVVFFSFLILVTRGLTLTHNMYLHPDETVFVKSSTALLKALVYHSPNYEMVKPYPEGTFVFHLPFHALRFLVARFSGRAQDPFLWGRIAGLFYFFTGWLVGAFIVCSFFGKSKTCLTVYGLSMCFSLLQIEQSRYGTGDPVSFFVITVILFSSAMYLSGKKQRWLCLSCFAAGALTAVKYPLILFAAIPFLALFAGERSGKRILRLLIGAGLVLCGFLLFSPAVVQDWHYLQRVFEAETAQYLYGGSISEVGGFGNHFLSVTIYHLLYSDILLGPVFFVLGIIGLRWVYKKENSAGGGVSDLFCKIVPAVFFVFFMYNLLVPLLYYRTFYPFFCISILYGSFAVGTWLDRRGPKHVLAVAVIAVMVCRGAFLVFAMAEKRTDDYLITQAESFTGAQEQRVVYLEPIQLRGLYDPGKAEKPNHYETIKIDEYRNAETGTLELEPGDLVITGNFEFGRAQKYILPIQNETVIEMIRLWDSFKKINAPYLRATTYPKEYYYLFGYWLKGSSAGSLEFPDNFIYFRPAER